jgi:hypothetical protein
MQFLLVNPSLFALQNAVFRSIYLSIPAPPPFSKHIYVVFSSDIRDTVRQFYAIDLSPLLSLYDIFSNLI